MRVLTVGARVRAGVLPASANLQAGLSETTPFGDTTTTAAAADSQQGAKKRVAGVVLGYCWRGENTKSASVSEFLPICQRFLLRCCVRLLPHLPPPRTYTLNPPTQQRKQKKKSTLRAVRQPQPLAVWEGCVCARE